MSQLARCGFYFLPATNSPDNVKCFTCAVKLDGWEPTDNPLAEHLAHAPQCAWATSLSVSRTEDEAGEQRDPMSEELVAARAATFSIGAGWPHEDKRGWRCKTSKMIEAGWTFDPSSEAEDGVTCFYCTLSLDGWEPKDDPRVEHQRRSPDCPFFELCEQYHGEHNSAVKGGKKGKGRTSTASKASRLSTQSAVSIAVSEAPSAAESVAVDDSIMSTASTATAKGGKKKGRPAKGAKGRKRANTVEPEPEIAVPETQPAAVAPRKSELPGAFPESSELHPEPEEVAAPPPPARATRNATRQADSSVIEVSQIDAPPKKATRGRKAKAQPGPTPEPEPTYEQYEQRLSDASAQLQEELEQSMDYHDAPDNESTPQPAPAAKAKRGTKRTSDGMKKDSESSIVMGMKFPEPPQPAVKAKKGGKSRKASKQHVPEPVEVLEDEQESGNWEVFPAASASPEAERVPTPEPEPEPAAKRAKTAKKAPAAKKGKGKGKKASSARSSKATVTDREDDAQHGFEPEVDDLVRDEAEIEAELARMATEQAVATEQERIEEYEASPLPDHIAPPEQEQHRLDDEMHAADEDER